MTRLAALSLFLLAACNGGGEPDLALSDAWARETGGGSTAAYVRIDNRGTGADRLVAVSAAPPVSASLHRSEFVDGIARMRPLDEGLEIGAGATAALTPGGDHVMVTGLPRALRPGDTLSLRLDFERSGRRDVEFAVRPAER